jgi:hypothetical protein
VKAAIFIESAGGEFFQKEAECIISSYNRMITRYGLDMEVFTYKNCDGGEVRLEDHTILIPGDMRDGWADRIYNVLVYIHEHVDCKWVIKTNTSTVLNLVELDQFMENRAPSWYHCIETKFWGESFTLNILPGKFWLFPKEFIPTVIEDFYNMLPNIDYWWDSNWGTNQLHRAPDDAIISYITTMKNIPSEAISEHLIVDIYEEWFSGLDNLNPGDLRTAMVFILRMHVSDDMALESKIRNEFEPKLMMFITRLIEDLNI